MLGYTTKIAIVKPARVVDRHNSETFEYNPDKGATVVDVEPLVSVQPTSQAEDSTGRVMLTSGWQLVTPPGVDLPLEAVDRVRFAGREADVAGEVARWPHPVIRGAVHHVEAQLTAVSG
ncbi:head-to-tail stopper [Gordonia phage Dardanus]|uniref:Head-to-tail stopper n=1 Tax=Gordonia phage Dardanus TaxID=2588489 RepID=A0A514CX07_9CAUD|nr:head closure Hc1 [Gordonia phage Dardanus]QDH85052.1 head-to-tail stopper [Gordonia phage Dardanus]